MYFIKLSIFRTVFNLSLILRSINQTEFYMLFPIRILVIEDSVVDLQLILRELRKGGFEPETIRVESAEAMKAALESSEWDLILSDYSLPQFDAPAALKLLRVTQKDIPFIVISGEVGEEVAVRLMKEGAGDYINKNNLTRLCPAIRRELEEAETRKLKGKSETLTQQMQIQLEEKNVNLNKLLDEKNQFLGVAAHDLRNPIGVIENFSNILLDNSIGALNDDQRKFVTHINKSSIFLMNLLEDLLDVSAIESGTLSLRKESFDFIVLLEEVLEGACVHARRKNINLKIIEDDKKPIHLLADKNKLYQVLNNLIENAIKYSPNDALVEVSCTSTESDLRLEVKDEGVGIPEDELDHLFQPFYRACNKPTNGEKRTGLGLFITKRIIDAHKGNLKVESENGCGSTFTFSIPIDSRSLR